MAGRWHPKGMSSMYRTVGKICGGCAGLAGFGYATYSAGVAVGGGPATSVHAHITAALGIAMLGGLAVVAWMLRDLERRVTDNVIQMNARIAALVREAVVSDEVRDMLMGFLARGITRGMLIERSTNTPKTTGAKAAVHNGRPMRVVGREEA